MDKTKILETLDRVIKVEREIADAAHKREFEIGCAFCHKLKPDVGALVQGIALDHRPIYICDECVFVALKALPAELKRENAAALGWGPEDHFEGPED